MWASGDGQALPEMGPRGRAVIAQLLARVTGLEFCEHTAGGLRLLDRHPPRNFAVRLLLSGSPGPGRGHQVRDMRAASRRSRPRRGRDGQGHALAWRPLLSLLI